MIFLNVTQGTDSTQIENILSSVCGGANILKLIYFVQKLLSIVTIAIPIILIVMIILDFGKNVIAGKEDEMKKNVQMVIKRIIMAVGFFLVPTIVSFIVTILGTLGVDYMQCINNATPSKIAALEKYEQALKEKYEQEEANKFQDSVDLSGGNSGLIPSKDPNNEGDSTSGTGGGNNTSDEENNSDKKTSVDFTKFDQCNQQKAEKTIKDNKGMSYKLYNCIKGYKLYNLTNNTKKLTMQNFAITKRYIYFSYTGRGAWANDTYKNTNGTTATLKKVSANYIVRISKSNNNYQLGYVEFAGHTQSFDVTQNDKIYLNYFSKLYKGSLGNGSKYVGLTWVDFNSNTKEKGAEIIPGYAISVKSDGTKFYSFSSSQYKENGKITSKYYEEVRKVGTSSGKMINPEIALDEANNQIALVSNSTAYIYKLSDLKMGTATLINKFTISNNKQGVELHNGYLYYLAGNKTFTLKKYQVSTGNLIKSLSFSLNNTGEAEGISIYNGNVYLGITGSDKSNRIYLIEKF